MKTIAVIVPIHNPEILCQEDVERFHTKEHYFQVHYVDTLLREIKTAEEAATLLPLTVKKIEQVAQEGASAAIVYAFGDLGIAEAKKRVSIPVMALGKSAVHMASMLCRNHYTVISSILAQDGFIVDLIHEEHLQDKYLRAVHSPELTPAEIRKDPALLEKLVAAAGPEIVEKNIDTFTLGCGSFINIAKKLEVALREKYKRAITVVDPVEVPFNVAKALV